MMLRLQRLAHISASFSIAIFFSVLTWKTPALLLHVNGVLTRAEGVESKLYATAGNLDKATKVMADSSKAEADALIDLTTDAHGTLWQINQTAYAAQTTLATVNDQAKHVGPLLDSLKASSDSIPPVMSDTGASIAQVGKLATDADLRVNDPHVANFMAHLDGMIAQGEGILTDGRKVSDKLTDDFVAHKPWYRKIAPGIDDAWDILGFAARHF